MKTVHSQRGLRITSALLSLVLTMPPLLASCGGQDVAAPPPPVDDTRTGQAPNAAPGTNPAKRQGLSTGQKTLITLAGAAALYYLYNQHKNAQGQAGPQGQYYLSKNGRVYYRDKQHRAHWVTPPPNGIQVPAQEAQRYRDFQGYDNRPTGRDLTSLPEAQSANF